MIKPLDETDRLIIEALETNGRQPNTDIAAAIGLSESAVRKRVDRLIDDGVIRIVGVSDPLKTGHEIIAILLMRAPPHQVDVIARELEQFDEFRFVGQTVGSIDFVGEAWFEDMPALYAFLSGRLSTVRGLTEVTTLTVHRMIRYAYDWGKATDESASSHSTVVPRAG